MENNFSHFCAWMSACAFTEYAEKYQEILVKQDYFHDIYGENGNEM